MFAMFWLGDEWWSEMKVIDRAKKIKWEGKEGPISMNVRNEIW